MEPPQKRSDDPLIKDGDFVMLIGGGCMRIVQVRQQGQMRIGRAGSVHIRSLIGMRFGEVLEFDDRSKNFVATNEHPDLDRTDISQATLEEKDNRFLLDLHGASQQLTHEAIAAVKEERGVKDLLDHLVENSATFASKTTFSQEKYIRKKKVKYALLFKVERITPDGLAECHIPTLLLTDQPPPESRWLRLRSDTVSQIVHYGNAHGDARIITYDRTNGVLQAMLLFNLGDNAKIYQVLDKQCHPNTETAKMMNLTLIKNRWRAVPRNPNFLLGEVKDSAPVEELPVAAASGPEPSHWIKGLEAREELLAAPADSLIVVDDEDPLAAVLDLLPFVALCGSIVVWSPFLDQLTPIYSAIRNDAVNIRISETWYRHHQVLSNRTHPTVNMSTAGGYLLTATRVEKNSAPSPRFSNLAVERKRPRD
jgi:tRNA (adenine-N(1)-)-methyltransferase non-catalytic subunit